MKTLLHIPHASLTVPDSFYDGLLIPREEFRRYNLKMSDVGVDELFRDVRGERVRSCYSRLFCDVERFRDDEKEVMSRFGEGVVYTKLYDDYTTAEYFTPMATAIKARFLNTMTGIMPSLTE